MRGGAEPSARILRDHLSALPALRALHFRRRRKPAAKTAARPFDYRCPKIRKNRRAVRPGGWRYNREETPEKGGCGIAKPRNEEKVFRSAAICKVN